MDMLSRLIQQASLRNADPMDQMVQMMENAKRNAAVEKTAPVLPMTYTSPDIMIFQTAMQREEFESNFGGKDRMLTRQTFMGNAPKFSSTPLGNLKRVYLKDMKIRKRHEGKYLLCRTITPPTRMVGVAVGVEDPNGWAQTVAVYNFPGAFAASGKELDTLFPLNTIIAIREPWAKMGLSGNNSQIRIDSPSDIIFLDPNDPLLNGVNWVNGKRTSRAISASSAEWKSVGDRHFKEKQYFAAAVAYSYALDKDPSFTAIRLNRCLAHIRLSNFTFALHDAKMVLKTQELLDADRVKAYYRAALSQYGSGRYEEAECYYKECLAIDPDLKDAVLGVEKCHNRINERDKGDYDWVWLLRQRETPCARPDIADHLGPIKMVPLQHRGGGRGVVATSDIKPGELLLVHKAFSVSFPKEFEKLGTLFAFNFLTNMVEKGTQYDLLQQTVFKIAANDHVGTPLLDLYAGADSNELGRISTSKIDADMIGNPLKFVTDIDIGRIEAIISFNSFGLSESSMTVGLTEVSPTKEKAIFDSASALYTYPSFLNHSCVGNATRETFGHVMVIRAVQDIPKGEEITMSYCGSEVSYPDRTSAIAKYFKECDCSLCVSDRAAGQRFHEALGKLHEEMSDSPSIKRLRGLVNKLDSLYPPSYPAYRPAAFEAHHQLATRLQRAMINATDTASRDRFAREAIEHEIIALEALGFHVTDKETKAVRPAEKKQIRLPISLNRSPYNSRMVCLVCWMIVGCLVEIGNEWRAEMWLRAAMWLQDKALGGGITLFRLRYAEVTQTFGPRAKALVDKIEKSP